MRLAVAGKGGAGKTTFSATLARLVARSGRAVVAVDADANPNLAAALGLGAAEVPALPASLVSRRQGGTALVEPVGEVLEQYGLAGPDGVRLVGMGGPQHAEQGCLCSAHAVVAALLADLGADDDQLVLLDMEASPEHLSRGTIREVDLACLVAEPYYRSLETVVRMHALIAELGIPRVVVVANKVRTPGDAEAVEQFCARHGFAAAGCLPWCEAVGEADRARAAVVDWPGTQPVTGAVAGLAATLGLLGASPGLPPA